MAKEKFERTKPHVNVGTIGHVDHGKTTLTAAIATVLAEEVCRGEVERLRCRLIMRQKKKRAVLRLHTSHVEYETDNTSLRTRRLPGSRRLHVKNMITGAAQMDGAILVVLRC